MSARITVTGLTTESSQMSFAVMVEDGGSASEYTVTAARGDVERLSREGEEPAGFIERCFRFLLEREPRESILRTFDVSVISHYFPEFEATVGR